MHQRTRNIVLTGFMGTGKTAVSAELAAMTGLKAVEVDAVIEQRAGISISEIFATQGEAAFRLMEAEAISALASATGSIISTGGGAVLRDDNMDALRASGTVVLLTASAETILERTARHTDTDRPLLKVNDPLAAIKELLEKRRPHYERADLTVPTDGKAPAEVAREILKRLGWKR